MFKTKYIYKIFTLFEWKKVQKERIIKLKSQPNDLEFVHLSKKDQISGTINRYFKKKRKLVMIKLSVDDLHDNLKWEKSRENKYYPHYYGCISTKIILDVKKIENE
tara:strand:+ start:107 stop:424 length:318 start_codon:yes stop_codon:yes gene_type:complete